jgi:phage tail-like protein
MPAAIEPVGDNRFKVKIGGQELGTFSEISGLSVEWEVVTRYVGGKRLPMNLLGNMKMSNLVLKRGIVKQPALLRLLTKGDDERSKVLVDVTVDVVNAKGEKFASWTLGGCRPVKWQGPALSGGTNGVATETLELAVTSLVPAGDTPPA